MLKLWEGHVEGKLVERISFPCCLFRISTPLLRHACWRQHIYNTNPTQNSERWQRKDNSIVLVLTAWVTMPLEGFGYVILASAPALVFNFLKHLCLCCSFGLNLSSHDSGHSRARSLGRRQRWSSWERGCLWGGQTMWAFLSKHFQHPCVTSLSFPLLVWSSGDLEKVFLIKPDSSPMGMVMQSESICF